MRLLLVTGSVMALLHAFLNQEPGNENVTYFFELYRGNDFSVKSFSVRNYEFILFYPI